MFDFLKSEKTLKRDALTKKLSDPKLHAVDIIKSGFDGEALDSIIASGVKKPAQKDAHDRDTLIRDTLSAHTALMKGNIEPAIAITEKSYRAFELITFDKKNENALKAKVELFKREEFSNPGGDFDDKQTFDDRIAFGASQAYLAIDGYAALGKAKETEEAIESFIKHNRFSENDHLGDMIAELADGNIVKGEAAVNVAHRRKRKFSLSEHDIVLKNAKNDCLRVQSILDMRNSLKKAQVEQRTEIENIALNHIKAPVKGKDDTSQLAAMKLLDEALGAHAHMGNAPEEYYTTVVDQLSNGAPHVLDTVFKSRTSSIHFLVGNHQFHQKNDEAAPETVAALIPKEKTGHGVAKARVHLAHQALAELTARYGAEVDHAKDDYNLSREVATLSYDVLVDGSLPADSKHKFAAADNLRQLIIVEDAKQARVADGFAKLSETSHELFHENAPLVTKNLGHYGVGRSFVSMLETIDATPESKVLAKRILAPVDQNKTLLNQKAKLTPTIA